MRVKTNAHLYIDNTKSAIAKQFKKKSSGPSCPESACHLISRAQKEVKRELAGFKKWQNLTKKI
jgi:hypothetical protein